MLLYHVCDILLQSITKIMFTTMNTSTGNHPMEDFTFLLLLANQTPLPRAGSSLEGQGGQPRIERESGEDDAQPVVLGVRGYPQGGSLSLASLRKEDCHHHLLGCDCNCKGCDDVFVIILYVIIIM